MDKVVILARVSTQAQDYQRQVTELQEYCDRAGWEVTRVFANKVSGAKAVTERTEIVEMVEYIKSNDIQRVVCLEISRLGRNTLEALKVINYLNENGVSLYVKNYNLETLVDGKVNPVASLICTILLEIASMETLKPRGKYRILYIRTAFIGIRQNAVIEPKIATSSLIYWIDIQSVMVKKKGHLPMKMSLCAGEGNRTHTPLGTRS